MPEDITSAPSLLVFESNLESNQGVVVYMFNADCHVGVVYLIMCKPTTLLHATLYHTTTRKVEL